MERDGGAVARPEDNLIAALGGALAALDERYRLPVSLCYEEGLSQREVATVLDMPERTVSKYVKVGLEKLRKALEGAGYVLLPAAVLAGLKETAPPVPASLASRLEELAAQGAAKATTGAAGASTAAAAKGGIAMKVIAGIILAGVVAAGLAVVSGGGGGGGMLPAEAAPKKLPEHPHDGRYTFEPIVSGNGLRPGKTSGRHFSRSYCGGVLDGPGRQAAAAATDELTADGAGNLYWTEPGGFELIRGWEAESGRVFTVAGSAAGYLDGPLTRARFSAGWKGGGYQYGNIAVSRDGKHLFVRDVRNSGRVRHMDLVAKTIKTLGKWFPVKDKTGDVYLLNLKGGQVPPGEGYKTLKTPQIIAPGNGKYLVLDVAAGKLYNHGRGPVFVFDLKTGKKTPVTWVSKGHKDPENKNKPIDTSGPFMERRFHCPVGLSISPGGRYLYVGGGDSTSFWRLDLEQKYIHIFGRRPDGSYGFVEGKENQKHTNLSDWPGAAYGIDDGSLMWTGGGSGIYRIAPAK